MFESHKKPESIEWNMVYSYVVKLEYDFGRILLFGSEFISYAMNDSKN